MRGHVEQLSVTANRRPPLWMESRETKGNKEMKHKHKPLWANLHYLRAVCSTGDVSPHYIVIHGENFPKLTFIKHNNVMFAPSFCLNLSNFGYISSLDCNLFQENKESLHIYFKVFGNRFLMCICRCPEGLDL